MLSFIEFPKIARLRREVVCTEKINGTNANVTIVREDQNPDPSMAIVRCEWEGTIYHMYAGSRSRWITPKDDNFGFAAWVLENSGELIRLGEGTHFGEYWGRGIQCNYGLRERRFSLFNVKRWSDPETRPKCCHVVPVLARGIGFEAQVEIGLQILRDEGSRAAPGYMSPEGVVAYHTSSNHLYKITLEADDEPKSKKEYVPVFLKAQAE